MLRTYKELDSAEDIKRPGYDLPPVREQKTYVTESGDYPGTPILISLAADDSVDDEIIQSLAENLRVSFNIFDVREETAAADRADLVKLLQQAADLLGAKGDPARYPAGAIAGHVNAALELASLWSANVADLGEDDVVPDSDAVIFIAFQVDSAADNEIPRPYEMAFHVDPLIFQNEPNHAYSAPGSPDVLTTVACSEGEVTPDLTGDGVAMGVLHASPNAPVSLRSGSSSASLYISGEAPRSYYTVTGRIRVD